MIQGLYAAASGMYAAMTQQARIGHNLTNSDTIGYKAFDVSPTEFSRLMDAVRAQEMRGSLPGDGVSTVERTDWAQGPLVHTSRELDIALTGPGFLTVRSAEGDHYTRSGRLHRSADGLLVTSEGYAVLGNQGPLSLPAGSVYISEEGDVMVDGELVDRLQLVEFALPDDLVRIGGTMFDGGVPPLEASNTRVLQGYVEGSNTDLTHSMTALVAAARMYQLSQRLTLQQSQILDQTVNDLARF